MQLPDLEAWKPWPWMGNEMVIYLGLRECPGDQAITAVVFAGLLELCMDTD